MTMQEILVAMHHATPEQRQQFMFLVESWRIAYARPIGIRNGRCDCLFGAPCPLGKVAWDRCTETELLAGGITVVAAPG